MTELASHAQRSSADHERGLVSVIVPARNAARWVDETIESALGQSYAPVEVVVVDNGSTDGTLDVAARHRAVRVERCAEPGPGAARNRGLEVARGEYVQFLDSDDLLAREKVARQVALLEATGAEVAWEPFHHLLPNDGGERRAEGVGYALGGRVSPRVTEDVAASLLSATGFIQIGALLVRRTERTAPVRFPGGREFVEDVRYAVELAMRGARFASSDVGKPGLLFRQHDGDRYSARPRAEFARACVRTAVWAQAHWERSGGLTPARRAALGDAYLFAARQLAPLDRGEFLGLAARLAEIDPGFVRRLPPRMRWLARLVGYPRAESVAARVRAVRSRLVSRRGTRGEASDGPAPPAVGAA